MAIRSVKHPEQFKEWLMQFDADKDGRISKAELREAIRQWGGRFAWWKARRAVRHVDVNGNGFVDDSEIENLVDFAQEHLGMKVST